MKLAKTLLLVGGAINALFFLFHCWLGWQIHRWGTGLPPSANVLLEMLNGGSALFILLLAIASLACPDDMLTTRLGHSVLAVACALYGLRAGAEIFLALTAKPVVVATCLATSALYLAIFILSRRAMAPGAAATVPAEFVV